MCEAVLSEATRVVARLDAARLFPARRALALLGGSVAAFALSLVFVAAEPDRALGITRASPEEAIVDGVEVEIIPPAYTGRPARTLSDPSRIEALVGSRIRLDVRARASVVRVETIDGPHPTGEDLLATTDGYIALEPVSAIGRSGVRWLMGLTVAPDAPPRVTLMIPGRDLLVPDGRRPLEVRVEAHDDLALATLRITFTKVSGSGERFTFVDGEVPLRLTRTNAQTWTGRGVLRVDSLDLAPGDMLVYRGIATDRRPGSLPSESDAYIVEVAAPGMLAAGGFAIDDERDRYAVSQQMVILKTQQLLAKRASLSAAAFAEEASSIAAAQRTVRAEFVFMMGGELTQDVLAAADMNDLGEEDHAEADDEAVAGRLVNRGRLDLLRAIRAMSQASAALNAAQVTEALVVEKSALLYLQRAFSRTQYILRALTERERLDYTRRLSGSLVDAARDTRPVAQHAADPGLVALRRALSDIGALAATVEQDDQLAARVSVVAASVLRVDPSSPPLQEVSARLAAAATAIVRSRHDEARHAFDSAAVVLSRSIRGRLMRAPEPIPKEGDARLDGALVDALRRTRVPR